MNYADIALADIRTIELDYEKFYRPDVSIEFAPEGERARKVVSRSNAKATGKYPSWKVGRPVHYESFHERNAFRLLDACPEVKSFREQPCTITYMLNGERHRHFPDLHVQLHNGRELWEVKTESDATNPVVLKRTEFMMKVLPRLGFNYRLVTAESLAQNPRLGNVKHILKFGFKPISLKQREYIRQLFKDTDALSWGSLIIGEGGQELRDSVSRLILEGFLWIDFYYPLSPETKIFAINQKMEV